VVTSLALSDGTPLMDQQAVVTGEQVVVHGHGLAGITSVQVDGVSSPVSDHADDHVTFVAFDPQPGRVGAVVSIVLVQGQQSTEVSAGQLRFYGVPEIADGGVAAVPEQTLVEGGSVEVVAPGLVVIEGKNFSTSAAEDLVSVGDGATAEVLVAEPERLLVNLQANFTPGPSQYQLQIQPESISGVPDRALTQLSTGQSLYVWEPLQASWLAPDQVRPGQVVTFRQGAPPLDLYQRFNNFGLGFAGPVDAGSGPPPQIDAGSDLSLTYVPNLGLGPAQTFANANSQTQSHPFLKVLIDGVVIPNLLLDHDGLDGAWHFAVPGNLSAGSHTVELSNPAGNGPNTPLVTLKGHLGSPGITCFPTDSWVGEGVFPEPLPHGSAQGTLLGYNFAQASYCDDGGEPVSIKSDGGADLDGGQSGLIALRLARYQPGGALDDPFCRTLDTTPEMATLNAVLALETDAGLDDDGGRLRPLGAGRHLAYGIVRDIPAVIALSTNANADTSHQQGLLWLTLPNVPPARLTNPEAVLEPDLDNDFFWAVSQTRATLDLLHPQSIYQINLASWPDFQVLGGVPGTDRGHISTFPNCDPAFLGQATFSDGALKLAVVCDNRLAPDQLLLSNLPLLNVLADANTDEIPMDGNWRSYDIPPAANGPWDVSIAGNNALLRSADGSLLLVADATSPGALIPLRLDSSTAGLLTVDEAAMSPDGQEVLALVEDGEPGYATSLAIFHQAAPGTQGPSDDGGPDGTPAVWERLGLLSLSAGSYGLGLQYDQSGSQVIVLLRDIPISSGTGVVDAGALTPVGGYCVVR
jgi:hypothetical protein